MRASGGLPSNIRLSPSAASRKYRHIRSHVNRRIYLFSIICKFMQMTGGDFLAKNKGFCAKAKLLEVLGPSGPGIKNIGHGAIFLSLPWN